MAEKIIINEKTLLRSISRSYDFALVGNTPNIFAPWPLLKILKTIKIARIFVIILLSLTLNLNRILMNTFSSLERLKQIKINIMLTCMVGI
jgi:hypothetical protein